MNGEVMSVREKKSFILEFDFIKNYYSGAIGGRIVGIKVHDDEYSGELWPVIVIENNGETFECELSQDPEGNGPGFLFGLPQYSHSKLYMDSVLNADAEATEQMFLSKRRSME
jgi:hypothetical protein